MNPWQRIWRCFFFFSFSFLEISISVLGYIALCLLQYIWGCGEKCSVWLRREWYSVMKYTCYSTYAIYVYILSFRILSTVVHVFSTLYRRSNENFNNKKSTLFFVNPITSQLLVWTFTRKLWMIYMKYISNTYIRRHFFHPKTRYWLASQLCMLYYN